MLLDSKYVYKSRFTAMNSHNLSRFPSNNIYFFHWTGFIRLEMPPARREPRYSMQDVIDIIQNGESEVEMELNDTDESDEDSDEDVCQQVDKENQLPRLSS
ncbi:hypothetical protein DPEC_G00096100 [Dallia pectoralis]|uniref:Uncharacterized protein n=1 Tax=Dallia pectoralis TaxID=75939 RepID=A0ACC2GVI5_DALPE|nr:hypothetical protein DPEC_G00096100 [Dallia pectoralis]